MKNSLATIAMLSFLCAFYSCKKNNTPPAPAPSSAANTPTCAYASSVLAPGGGISQFITFMDLSNTVTAEKKYFTIQLKYVGVKDSFEVITLPQSVNNLAKGFPAEITSSPGFGLLNQWINPQYALKADFGNYLQDTIVRNPASNYYFLYQRFLSGPLQGAWPQSNFDNYNVPTGQNGNNILHFRTIFYFKKGLCIDANAGTSGANTIPIETFYKGAPNYDWLNIDAAIQIVQFPVSAPSKCNFYFFDFKNWRYFRWEQFNSSILNNALGTQFYGYESLDRFIKWPQGWGKK